VRNRLVLHKGDTRTYRLTFKDKTGNPLDLTDLAVYFVVKNDDADTSSIIEKIITSHLDPTNGITEINLSSSDTDIDYGIYYFEIYLLDGSGQKTTILTGNFIISADGSDKISDITFVFQEETINVIFDQIIELSSGGSSSSLIDDNTVAANKTWSSQKIENELSGKAPVSHQHTTSDITDYTSTTQATIDNSIYAHNNDSNSHQDIRNELSNKATKITSPTADNILVQSADGDLKDGGKKLSDLALANHTHTTSQITDFNSVVDGKISNHNTDTSAHNDIRSEISAKPDIDDTVPSTSKVYSSQKVEDLLTGKSDANHTHTLGDLSDVDTTGATSGQVLQFNGSLWVPASAGGSDTFKTKVSGTDTTEDFLESKIVAGSNITITKLNSGGNEQLEIASSGGGGTQIIFDQTLTANAGSVLFSGLNLQDGELYGIRLTGILDDGQGGAGIYAYGNIGLKVNGTSFSRGFELRWKNADVSAFSTSDGRIATFQVDNGTRTKGISYSRLALVGDRPSIRTNEEYELQSTLAERRIISAFGISGITSITSLEFYNLNTALQFKAGFKFTMWKIL